MRLWNPRQGDEVRLRELPVGRADRLRLLELGLLPGVTIRVVTRATGGGLVVSFGDSRVALDGTLARRLLVDPIAAGRRP